MPLPRSLPRSFAIREKIFPVELESARSAQLVSREAHRRKRRADVDVLDVSAHVGENPLEHADDLVANPALELFIFNGTLAPVALGAPMIEPLAARERLE